jgi:DNA invertase Pin-like site-specific DNA recombinase
MNPLTPPRKHRKLRLDSLIRVSQRNGREGDSFRSPDQQRDVVNGWAKANDARVVHEHPAVDVSGKTMARPDVDDALARIRAGHTDGIVVAWLDRFSRAPVDEALRVYREIQEAGGQVVAADMAGLNPDDPTGEMALTTMLAVGRMQWRQRANRWNMSRADAIEDGKAIGGAPFGYRFRDGTPKPSGKGVLDSRLVVVEELRPIVVELFERRAGGATWLELARWLDQVAPKPDGRHWQRTTVRGIIGRRTYLGIAHHGKHEKIGAHEALVPAALWRRAQPEPGQRTPRGNYLLSGRVRCAECGRRMRASSGGKRKPAVYVCITPECPARYSTVTVKGLDEEVVAQLEAHLDAYHVRAADDAELKAAEREVREREGAVQRLAAVVPSHSAAIEAHQAALRAEEQALAAAEDHLHELVASRRDSGPDVHTFRSDWPDWTLAERREYVRATIDVVLVRRSASRAKRPPVRDRIRVLFSGEAPAGLLDTGRTRALTRWCWTGDWDPVTAVAAA